MADVLAPIAEKLRPLIRLLASDQPGEVVAAARALARILKSKGADLHVLADSIGHANGGLSKDEMKVIYDAGYADGMRAVEDKHCDADGFHNIDGSPSWHAMAVWCQRHADQLRHNERQFINNVASRTVWREPTEKERKWLRSIHFKLGGKPMTATGV